MAELIATSCYHKELEISNGMREIEYTFNSRKDVIGSIVDYRGQEVGDIWPFVSSGLEAHQY